jgi:hypothetical protein
MRKDLLESGLSQILLALFFGILPGLLLSLDLGRPCTELEFLLASAFAGLFVQLLAKHPTPLRTGQRFRSGASLYTPYEEQLAAAILAHRSPWVTMGSGVALGLVGCLYGLHGLREAALSTCLSNQKDILIGLSTYGSVAFLFSFAAITGLEYLYVWYKLHE